MNEHHKMKPLLVRFVVDLEDHSLQESERPHGPIFHRWLPNGIDDAIKINIGNKGSRLLLYFEQRGIVRNNLIQYEDEKLENSSATIRNQARLDAGPLHAVLEFIDYSTQEIAAITNNFVGTPIYLELAKSIVKTIAPYIEKIINVLIYEHGQYWIKPFEKYDSRRSSIGHYCSSYLQMAWSFDEGKTWNRFEPEKVPSIRITVTMPDDKSFQKYLTEEDWNTISSKFGQSIGINVAHIFLLRAHRLFSTEQISQGVIEGIISLEAATNNFVSKCSSQLGKMKPTMNSFESLPLTPKTAAVLTLSGKFSQGRVENVLKAIEIRNKIVHDGHIPIEISNDIVSDLLSTVSVLLGLNPNKFPRPDIGNRIYNS